MKSIFFTIAFGLFCCQGFCQTISIDLADEINNEIPVEVGQYDKLIILNLIPADLANNKYTIQISIVTETPTLDGIPEPANDKDDCSAVIKQTIADLDNAKTEKDISDVTKKLNKFIKDGVSMELQ